MIKLKVVRNETKGTVVCRQCECADGFVTRLFGLLRRKGFDTTDGLLITPSSGIHTFGMSFPIDVVSLDNKQRVITAHSSVKRSKIRCVSWRTRSVLELPVGTIQRNGIEPGDVMDVEVRSLS